MTQPDRRHLRRARLALAVVVAAALAAAVVPGGRTFLQQSLTALASRSAAGQRVYRRRGRRPRWSHLR